MQKGTEKIVTPGALLDHLSSVMTRLDDGKISIEHAKTQADLVRQANNLLRYQLDLNKLENKIESLK